MKIVSNFSCPSCDEPIPDHRIIDDAGPYGSTSVLICERCRTQLEFGLSRTAADPTPIVFLTKYTPPSISLSDLLEHGIPLDGPAIWLNHVLSQATGALVAIDQAEEAGTAPPAIAKLRDFVKRVQGLHGMIRP